MAWVKYVGRFIIIFLIEIMSTHDTTISSLVYTQTLTFEWRALDTVLFNRFQISERIFGKSSQTPILFNTFLTGGVFQMFLLSYRNSIRQNIFVQLHTLSLSLRICYLAEMNEGFSRYRPDLRHSTNCSCQFKIENSPSMEFLEKCLTPN